jgi:hypothetical protein
VVIDPWRCVISFLVYLGYRCHGNDNNFKKKSIYLIAKHIPPSFFFMKCSAIGATLSYLISKNLGSVFVLRLIGERANTWKEQVIDIHISSKQALTGTFFFFF